MSLIYVTAHRCAGGLKKLNLQAGSQRHRHFVGFFNVPVQAPTRDPPFTVIPRNRPILVAFYDTHWDTEDTFSTPTSSVRLHICAVTYMTEISLIVTLNNQFTLPYLTLYEDSDTPPQLVAFYDTLGIRRTYSHLKPRRHLWLCTNGQFCIVAI